MTGDVNGNCKRSHKSVRRVRGQDFYENRKIGSRWRGSSAECCFLLLNFLQRSDSGGSFIQYFCRRVPGAAIGSPPRQLVGMIAVERVQSNVCRRSGLKIFCEAIRVVSGFHYSDSITQVDLACRMAGIAANQCEMLCTDGSNGVQHSQVRLRRWRNNIPPDFSIL